MEGSSLRQTVKSGSMSNYAFHLGDVVFSLLNVVFHLSPVCDLLCTNHCECHPAREELKSLPFGRFMLLGAL